MHVCVHSCLQVHIVDRMTWKINYTTAHLNKCPRQIMGYIQEVLIQKFILETEKSHVL